MFCGIDLGTSSIKAAVYDEQGTLLSCARYECELITPKTGWAELNPYDYADKVLAAIKKAIHDSKASVETITISSQAQAVLPIDRKDDHCTIL